eukprot:1153388-Amphidinium_carterae.1
MRSSTGRSTMKHTNQFLTRSQEGGWTRNWSQQRAERKWSFFGNYKHTATTLLRSAGRRQDDVQF